MGQVGRGAFAINVGGKELVSGRNIAADNMTAKQWNEDVLLFETPKASANKFGYTGDTPAISRVRVNRASQSSTTSVTENIRQAVFISNGYNYTDTLSTDTHPVRSNETALYIYDALGVDVGTERNGVTGDAKGTLI